MTYVCFAYFDLRQLLIALPDSTRSTHLAQTHQLGQRAFKRRETARMHIRRGVSEIPKRRRFERCDHPLQKAVGALARATKGRVAKICKVPVAEIGASSGLLQRRGNGSADRRGSA